MAQHRRRRQTALSGATGRSRRCASGCIGDTRWLRRCGAATARAAATSSAIPTARARTRDFRRAGEGAALDLLATVEWAKAQRDLVGKRWLLVGQSAGGFASIYTASK